MASIDRLRSLADIVAGATDGVPYATAGENNRRTERYQLKVTCPVTVTAAGTNRNRGSVLALLPDVSFLDGGVPKVTGDARLQRALAESFAPSALPATRLD